MTKTVSFSHLRISFKILRKNFCGCMSKQPQFTRAIGYFENELIKILPTLQLHVLSCTHQDQKEFQTKFVLPLYMPYEMKPNIMYNSVVLSKILKIVVPLEQNFEKTDYSLYKIDYFHNNQHRQIGVKMAQRFSIFWITPLNCG